MSSEFLNRPGTVDAGDGTNSGVAAHYGNPIFEQRQLAAGTAIVDLSHRAVITITGPDRLSWINSLTSQSVAHLAPGESTETLLLNMTGRIEYAVRLIDDGTNLWLLLEREKASGLLQRLAACNSRCGWNLRIVPSISRQSAPSASLSSRWPPRMASHWFGATRGWM